MTTRRLLLGIAAAVTVVLVAGVALLLWSRRDRPVTPADVDRAVVACHKAVEGRLIAGASARYSAEHPEVSAASFRITGTVETVEVDDKGVSDRSTYVCEGERPDGGFTVTDLQLVPR